MARLRSYRPYGGLGDGILLTQILFTGLECLVRWRLNHECIATRVFFPNRSIQTMNGLAKIMPPYGTAAYAAYSHIVVHPSRPTFVGLAEVGRTDNSYQVTIIGYRFSGIGESLNGRANDTAGDRDDPAGPPGRDNTRSRVSVALATERP